MSEHLLFEISFSLFLADIYFTQNYIVMRKVPVLTLLSVMITTVAFSQVGYWSANNENRTSIPTDKAVSRLTYPKEFKLFNLNAAPLKQTLFAIVDKQAKGSTIITLPNADGNFEQFEVFEASNFDPELQAKFPEIRAYSGRSITDKGAVLKLSISPGGIQSMVFRANKANEFIEPYSQDHTVYSVYSSHRDKGQLQWTCSTVDEKLSNSLNSAVNRSEAALATGNLNGTIKTLRLAQSCNAEYSNYFKAFSAADVSLVLAAFNVTLTRCNGVYEKDLALHLNLIANTTSVIYYNPATDPYSTNMSSWNNQLQSTLTSVIGEANYDIGHMFGASGGGGNAGCIGCVCVNGQKGSGITSPADGIPEGDNFDIDYVVHEVGHQLGANHTFSMSLEGTGQNKEVGSGITIMGYAGITSQDVAPHSIEIFHEPSIETIQSNMSNKTYSVTTEMTANHAPVVNPVSNYTIPISTPFALTASATDPENDPLTYCWEQNDNSSTSGSSSVAFPTKTTGPNWLSFSPITSGTRLFPRLSTILAGANVTGPLPGGDAGANIEALSSVSRTLNFRVTVRDNKPYVEGSTIGQTAFTDAVVTVTNTAGPFAVTSPNTNITWPAGSAATVTWDVKNTNTGSVNCLNVNILLSTDGGNNFSMLLANTPNDGSETVNVPNTPGTLNRIKVEAAGNIFFDISNTNFTIGTPSACGNPTGLNETNITKNSATVSWSAVSGASSYDVEYKPNSSSNFNSAGSTSSTSLNLSGLSASTLYDWRVRANCSGGQGSYVADQFSTLADCTPDTEPNNNTTQAKQIFLNTTVKGTIAVKNDNDYYFLNITTGGTIAITLTGLPANYDLSLLNSSGTPLATSANNGTNPESISRTVIAGIYYVRVYPRNNGAFNASSCYTLNVSSTTASREDGRLITDNGGRMNLFPNPAGNVINVSLPGMNDKTELKVYNIMGNLVMRQITNKTNTELNVAKLPAGVYMISASDGVTTSNLKFVKE
jgi:hypothetical protein